MALVGEAHIIVRAITTGVAKDIQKGFNGIDGIGRTAGKRLNGSFMDGFNSNPDTSFLDRIKDGLDAIAPAADAARASFHDMVREGYTLGTALSTLIGGIFSVIGGFVSLGGAALGAIPSVLSLANVITAVGLGMGVVKLATGGIGKAIALANKQALKGVSGGGGGKVTAAQQAAADAARVAAAKQVEDAEKRLAKVIQDNRDSLLKANDTVRKSQLALNAALKAGREEIQQLGFKAEDAALAEKKASLDLEDARATLAAVQDLPPNSRARQQAELAYQEAELNLRKAKDASNDLNAEQERLAKTGVRGTDVVINATQALADAQTAQAKTVRDGLQSQQDAVDALADAKANAAKKEAAPVGGASGGAAGGGVDPFARLNSAQKEFAKFLLAIKPKFDQLKLIAAESFLPKLQEAITTLMTVAYPTVAVGIGQIGSAMGDATISIANAISDSRNLKSLSTLFTDSADIIRKLGDAISSAWGIALSVLNITAPTAKNFLDFVNTKLKSLDTYLKTDEGASKVKDFFDQSSKLMARFGKILSNTLGGIGGLIAANMGPGTGGDILLTWLTNATQGFEDMGKTAEGKANLKQYFADVATNTQSIMSSIGALLSQLIKLGADKSIGETFDILKKGAPALGDILKASADAGPALAGLVVQITKIVDALTDSVAIQVFFNTLKGIADVLLGFFSNPLVHAIMDVTGRIAAFLLALGLVGKIGKFAFKVLLGEAGLLRTGLGLVGGAFTTVGKLGKLAFSEIKILPLRLAIMKLTLQEKLHAASMKITAAATAIWSGVTKAAGVVARGFGVALRFMMGPIGIAITIIAALVASLVWFFTQTDLGKKIWKDFSKAFVDTLRFIGEMFSNIWQGIVTVYQAVLEGMVVFFSTIGTTISGVWNAIWGGIAGVFTVIWQAIVAYVQLYIQTVWNIIMTVVTAIQVTWNGIWQAISDFVGAIWKAISDYVSNAIGFIQNIINDVVGIIRAIWEGNWSAVGAFLADIWKNIVGLVQNQINFVLSIIRAVGGLISGVWNAIWSGISSFFSGIWNAIIGAVQGLGRIFHDAFSGIAGFVRGAFEGVLGAVKGPINAIIGIVNNAIKSLNKLKVTIPNWVPFVGGQTWGLSLPTIPMLAKGGTVMPSVGGSLVNVAEAGKPERIEPLDANGMSKRDHALFDILQKQASQPMIQITIQAAPDTDIEELAKEVGREVSKQIRKGSL